MSTSYAYLPGCIKTPSFENRGKPGGVYNKITAGFMKMGANAELNQDFFRFNFAQAWSSNYSFRGIDSKQYTGNVFGKIVGKAYGTHIGAQGNHFAGNDLNNPKLLDDYTKTKCTIVLGCPSLATPAVSDLFYNQICTLSSSVIPKEMVKSLKPGGELDGIILNGPPLYTVLKRNGNADNVTSLSPTSPTKRNLKKRNWSASNDHGPEEHEEIQPPESAPTALVLPTSQQIYVGAEYDHRLMPDFGGPVFAMKKAKLIQPQWTNINNDLIVPWEYYNYLRPGTVVVATICIEVFVMPVGSDNNTLRKIYHATITSLKVVADSDLVVLPPTPSIMRKNVNQTPELSSLAATALAAIDWSTSSTSPSASSSDQTLEDINDKIAGDEGGNSGYSSNSKESSGITVPSTTAEDQTESGNERNAIKGHIENTGESKKKRSRK
ncbi:MAG: hypothetical protein NXY57DRAFT_965156 [Lentinula lateritia]|nr:MAG: hypothetical protein NXY57DRAFT_965156 [Lentinula lateritia]